MPLRLVRKTVRATFQGRAASATSFFEKGIALVAGAMALT
jgi:hypothetical protein